MKYLVTGGAGFIGSNITHRLVELGEDVTVIDNLSTGYLHNLNDISNKIKFIRGDIKNLKLLKKITKNQDFIIHQYISPRNGDIIHSLANIDKVKALLKYKVLVDFEQGIEKTIDWYKKNG